MSSVISKNIQIGADTTATNNFTIYQPATPNGTLLIGNGNTGITSSLVTLNSSGNLGLGVTPSAWTPTKVLQLGGEFLAYSGITGYLTTNAYYGSLGFTYNGTGPSARYEQASGAHIWYRAPSGTAGNAITFTQAMTLDASGRNLIGTSVSPSSTSIRQVLSGTTVGQDAYLQLAYGGGGGGYIASASGAGITFGTYTGAVGSETYSAERARIDSSGNLLVGTTSGIGRVVTNSGVAASTSHGIGVVGTANSSAYQGGYFSVRMVTINGDGGANSGNIYVAGAYGAKGVCIAAFDSSGNSVSPSATVTSSNLCTFVALVSI